MTAPKVGALALSHIFHTTPHNGAVLDDLRALIAERDCFDKQYLSSIADLRALMARCEALEAENDAQRRSIDRLEATRCELVNVRDAAYVREARYKAERDAARADADALAECLEYCRPVMAHYPEPARRRDEVLTAHRARREAGAL